MSGTTQYFYLWVHNQEIDLARSTCEHLLKLKLADSSEKGAELNIHAMIGADFFGIFFDHMVNYCRIVWDLLRSFIPERLSALE